MSFRHFSLRCSTKRNLKRPLLRKNSRHLGAFSSHVERVSRLSVNRNATERIPQRDRSAENMPDTKCTKLTRSNPRRSFHRNLAASIAGSRRGAQPSTRRRSAPPQGSLIFTARHGRFFAALCYGEKDTAAHGNYCIPAARRTSP